MVAANVAAAYVNGCSWAGLAQKVVLLVDADLAAPGCHYYPFVSERKPWKYRIKNKSYATRPLLLEALKKNSQGLLYLLYAVAIHPEFRSLRAKFSHPKTPQEIDAQNLSVYRMVADILKEAQNDPLNAVNPWNHVIQLLDEKDNIRMLILPAGDPEQEYFQQVLDFDWKSFYEQNGTAVLHAIYSTLSHGATLIDRFRQEQKIPRAECILLDQEAGLSLPSIGNRLFASRQVVVSGLNAQNQDGLFGLLNYGNKSDMRIVLSQYQGRAAVKNTEGGKNGGESMNGFRTEDQVRAKLIEKLGGHGISERNVFLADFVPEATNKEFLADAGSHYFNEIIRLIVSMETEYRETKISISEKKEIRLLGEFVGIAGRDVPNGPLGAFREWAVKHALPSGFSVTGIATGHEEIAKIVTKKEIHLTEIPPDSENRRSREANDFTWPQDNLAHLYPADLNSGKKFRLNDFDIVAMPVYLLHHAQPHLEFLDGPTGSDVKSSDRIGPLSEEYFANSIKGWGNDSHHDYTHIKIGNEKKLIGYPLFVDSPLIAYNTNHIDDKSFGEEYFNSCFRRFRGFQEPADVLQAARSASSNKIPNDRLIMTLKHGHIAKWYEWQTVLGIFGACDFDISNPWESLLQKSRLTDPKTIRATKIYLELCRYAEKSSDSADWDKAIAHFFKDQTVGMAFIWPDAIPLEYREVAKNPIFEYAIPPGDFHYEECWLLTIPANRRAGAPTRRELEHLLQQFLTYDSQLLYHSMGGVSVHRRVLQSPNLWKEDAWLPEFSKLESRGTMMPRMASQEARQTALKIVEALEQLREMVKDESDSIHEQYADLDPWDVPAFKELIEGKIVESFKKI